MGFFDAVTASPSAAGASGSGANPLAGAPAPAVQSSNSGGFFSSIKAPAAPVAQAAPSKSFFGDISSPTPSNSDEGANQPPSKIVSPYFSAPTPGGGEMGFSTTTDPSGKPLFAYRNPGDTSTTTDMTRVATTFDPRVAQPMNSDTFYNPRNVANRAALKTAMGGTYSDELDHTIPLELSGSNEDQNLRIEPDVKGTTNTATDPLETQLAKEVAAGKISLFDAQTQMAKAKGTALPWTGSEDAGGKSNSFVDFLNSVAGKVHDAFGAAVHTGQSLISSAETNTGKTISDISSVLRQPLTPTSGNPVDAAKAGWDSLVGTIDDSAAKLNDMKDTLTSYASGGPTTGAQATAATGEAALGLLNGIFSPITAGIAAASKGPGIVGITAQGVSKLFSAIGVGASDGAQGVVNSLPFLSDDQKATLAPVVGEAAALVAQILAGNAGAHVLPKVASKTKDILTTVSQHIKDIPNKEGGFIKLPGNNPESGLPEVEKNATDYVNQNKASLKTDYTKQNGNVYNVDRMKDLIPGHVENPTISEAFHKPAANLMGDMVNEKLKSEPNNGKDVVFMGGATGAGKSTAVDGIENLNDAHAIIDGTLADGNRSRDQMRTSLQNGHPVEIRYVDNTPERISDNIIARAKAGGRTVPIERAYDTLLRSRQNVLRANGEFGKDPNFKVSVIDNRGPRPYEHENGIDYLKENPYSKEDIAQAKEAAYAKVQKLYEQGEITPEIYKGLTREQPRTAESGNFEAPSKEHPGEPEKGISSEVTEAKISNAIDEMAGSKDPAAIKSILEEELNISKDESGRLADRISTLTSPKNIRRVLEGEDLTRKPANQALLEKLPEDLKKRAVALDIRRDALENNRAAGLTKYVAKAGEFKGRLPEVTGKAEANIFGRRGDDIITEHGFSDSEEARTEYEKYAADKDQFRSDESKFKEDLKEHLKTEKQKASAKRSYEWSVTREQAMKAAEKLKNKLLYEAELKQKMRSEAVKANRKPDNIIKAYGRDLNPLKYQDPETQDIFKTWYGQKLAAKELAQEEFNKFDTPKMDDMATIHLYQDGMLDVTDSSEASKIKGIFDAMHNEAYDRGVELDYRKNYLPQLYAESKEIVRAAAVKMLEDKGMILSEIEAYMRGEELPIDARNRLKMHAFFSEARMFNTYAEAERYGLHPKYKNIPALAAYYRETLETIIANKNLIQQLAAKGKIAPEGMAPKTWDYINAPSFKGKGYMASPSMVKMLDGFFRDENNLTSSQVTWKTVATINKFAQHMVLSTGVPYTNIHFFGIGQVFKSLETAAGALVSGRPDIAKVEAGNMWAFLKSHSNTLSTDYFRANQHYITMMAKEGINIGDHIARFGELYGQVSRDTMWHKVLGTVKDNFEKVFTRKMFGSMLPQLYIGTFKTIYENALHDGMHPEDAQRLAADYTRKNFGMSDLTMRSKDVENKISAVFFAPKFRENLVNVYLNGAKSLNFKNSSLSASRSFIVGSVIMYAAYNVLNKEINGNYMWDNPPGRMTYLRVPLSSGNVIYVPFGPSIFAFIRNAVEGTDQIVHGQFVPGAETEAQNLSMAFQVASQVITNTNYYGNPIYNPNDTTAVKTAKLAQYVGGQVSPAYITGVLNLIEQKNQPLYETLLQANAFPLSFSTTAKEQTGVLINTKNAQTAATYQAQQSAEAEYAKLKGSPDAASQFEQLQSSNPKLAAAVSTIATQAMEGFTTNERLIKSLGVANGERAKAIANAINALPDQAAKSALWDRYLKLKIISPQVASQLGPLINK